MIKIKEREVQFTGYKRRQSSWLPETPVSVGLVDGDSGGGGGAGPVFLDVVLRQQDPVLQVGQGGTEVVLLVSLPPGVESITLGYAAVNVHTETTQIFYSVYQYQYQVTNTKLRIPSTYITKYQYQVKNTKYQYQDITKTTQLSKWSTLYWMITGAVISSSSNIN